MKKKTGKKMTVVRDELKVKGAGLYCYMPFEEIDAHKKAVFKIGIATKSINSRTEQYHTYFPNGVYIVAFLENPRIPMALRYKKEVTKKTHFEMIETFLMDYVEEDGGKPIFSTTRVKKGGQTEWIYASEVSIHEAFEQAHKMFGGILHMFYLEGTDPKTNKFTSINDIAKKEENEKPNYVGKIIFHT
jgi:hypothetical protein